MKQFIVLMAMIFLGVMIYRLVAGPEDGSVLNTVRDVWQQEIEFRTEHP